MTLSDKEIDMLNKMKKNIDTKNSPNITKEDLAETCKRFDKETKAKKQALSKKKWEQRKKTYNKWAKRTNAVLDWIEGTPTKKTNKKTHKTTNKPRSHNYVIKGGVAYPIAKKPRTAHKKPVKKRKKTKDPFDFKIKW